MKVAAPDGTRYRVRRRWLPWALRRRVSPRPLSLGTFLSLEDFDPFEGLPAMVAGILIWLVAAIALPAILLVLLTGVELFLLLLVLPLAVVARFALGRRWHVEVRQGLRLRYDTAAGDWTTSGAMIAELTERIRLRGLEGLEPGERRVHVTSTRG